MNSYYRVTNTITRLHQNTTVWIVLQCVKMSRFIHTSSLHSFLLLLNHCSCCCFIASMPSWHNHCLCLFHLCFHECNSCCFVSKAVVAMKALMSSRSIVENIKEIFLKIHFADICTINKFSCQLYPSQSFSVAMKTSAALNMCMQDNNPLRDQLQNCFSPANALWGPKDLNPSFLQSHLIKVNIIAKYYTT